MIETDYNKFWSSKFDDYPVELQDIGVGTKFEMLNYHGKYMRVAIPEGTDCIRFMSSRWEAGKQVWDVPYTGGHYIPIMLVESPENVDRRFFRGVGEVFLMSGIKPCRVVPSDPQRPNNFVANLF